MPLYVTFYETGPDALDLLPVHYPAHRARSTSSTPGATCSWSARSPTRSRRARWACSAQREAAEEFVADDPFVTSGAVGNWYLREWNEVLLTDL